MKLSTTLGNILTFAHLNGAVPAKAEDGKEKDENDGDAGKKEGEEDGDGDGGEDGDEGDDKEAAAFTRGVTTERTRIGQILASPEAGTNPALAAHLACNTDMSADAVIAALKTSPAPAKGGKLADAIASSNLPKPGPSAQPSQSTVDAGWGAAIEKANAGLAKNHRRRP